jgi:hypothetical protein
MFPFGLGKGNMNYPYDLLYLDVQAAKQGLTRSLQPGPGPHVDTLFPPIAKRVPVANDQRWTAKRPALLRDFTRSRSGSNNQARNTTPPKRFGWTGNDLSAFSFSLTLLLLGNIAAAGTNHPAFWLSIGPAPLVGGFTILTLFRKRSGRRGPFVIFGKRDDC